MTFLNPAVLLGLLAASIPILIHLLNLRKLKRVEFSSLMFLKELQKNQIRKIKLKQWLLLLIRTLIVIFLVTAFARPTLETAVIGGTSSTVKTTAVFILDDSFSMEILEPNGSRFNIAKNIARQLLAELKEGDDAAIIFLSDAVDEKIAPTKNLSELTALLEEKNISFVSRPIHSAFVSAARVLEKSQNYSKEIYFISDFQNAKKDEVNSDFSQIFNERVKLFLFRFDEKEINNLAIDSLRLNTQIFEKNKPVSVSAFVRNLSNKEIDNRVISMFINGERSAQRGINLNAGQSSEIILEGNMKNSGFTKLVVEAEDDELSADNKKFLSFYIPEKINVLTLIEKPGDEKFLASVLKTLDPNAVNVIVKNIQQFNSSELADYEVLYLIGANQNISAPIKKYLEGGGGVFLFPSSVGAELSMNNFLTALNLPAFKKKIILEKNYQESMRFKEIDFLHPMFQNLFEANKKKEIEAPEFISYFQHFTEGKGSRIIAMPDGSSFLSEFKLNGGKILIANVSPTLEQSALPLKSIFVTMLVKSLYYLSSSEANQQKIFAGDDIILSNAKFPDRKIRLSPPSQNDEYLNVDDRNGRNYFSFAKTFSPGFYEFYSGDKLTEVFSVNVDADESSQQFLNRDEFENYLEGIKFKGTIEWIDFDSNFTGQISRARFGSELWKIFLIAALLFALFEMFLSRTTKKDLELPKLT